MAIAKGYAATDASQPLTPFTFERREPNEDDVVISVKYCGVCHSDIHQARSEWGNGIFPMVPGHEVAGIVTSVGSKVTKFKTGDRVGVGCFVNSCTKCAERNVDLEQYMPGLVQTYNDYEADGTTPTYGGYSDSIVVKEGYVLSFPENLPLDAAAPLLCAGITLYSPLHHWKAGPGKKVAIVGMGGLGHMGVKIAHRHGCRGHSPKPNPVEKRRRVEAWRQPLLCNQRC
ncbi:D-arabinose 1-dehydrogenase-like Zn-dependent alcohol dehydrogenase [Phyllobacterium ifriqiyense]|uniref:D-arabinose 1-dehydrogenase-like Zn-dependent alcohol dehydrogenase n=1 Tax=Phyllobacterium ifriqiyense TaxID=314238 RepID=A0ABU0S538_9HYPH|nr:D-arabinose 1-dehydrogenase-like Zn-dependent alcohol dehydrogenase [Phyllobacterium ifriqiyense]